jgi:hypothetical protein
MQKEPDAPFWRRSRPRPLLTLAGVVVAGVMGHGWRRRRRIRLRLPYPNGKPHNKGQVPRRVGGSRDYSRKLLKNVQKE